MRMDKLTSKFQQALADAQSLAIGRDHQYIEPLHVMAALLDQQGGSVRPLLDKAGVNVNLLRSQLGEALERVAKVEGNAGELLTRVRDRALRAAGGHRHLVVVWDVNRYGRARRCVGLATSAARGK